MKNIGKLLFILGILGNSIALNASCISNITSSSKYFINTSSSTFQTNDIQKAEENANFTLMFPNYLPECIDHQVKINGYLRGQQYLDETKVIFKIQYSGNKGNNCIVLIDERKGPITSLPSSKENSNNINVLGIDILEERRTILLSNSGPVATTPIGSRTRRASLTTVATRFLAPSTFFKTTSSARTTRSPCRDSALIFRNNLLDSGVLPCYCGEAGFH